MRKNDDPELDTTEIIEGQQVNHYLMMIGQLQWLITLGRFDTQAQVISMSRFRAQLTQGHLERLNGIYAYVIRTKDYATRFRITEPDYSYLPEKTFIGLIQFMVMFRNSYHQIFQMLWVKLLLLLQQWMQIKIIA